MRNKSNVDIYIKGEMYRINKLHERDFRLIYDDYKTSFSDLLAIDGSFTIHHTNV